MNEQQLAAVKQALEALESERDKYLEWGDEDGAPEDVYEAITALQSIISQDALHKMAEDAVTIGLSYNDWPKIGCVNHDCDKCKAVQGPVATVKAKRDGGGTFVHWTTLPVAGMKLYTTPPAPQPVPVKTYSDGKPWPVAPKPWVGLTHEDMMLLVEQARKTPAKGPCPDYNERLLTLANNKLKEKNHDH